MQTIEIIVKFRSKSSYITYHFESWAFLVIMDLKDKHDSYNQFINKRILNIGVLRENRAF